MYQKQSVIQEGEKEVAAEGDEEL